MILFPIYCCEWYRWYSSLFTVVSGIDDDSSLFTVVSGNDDTLHLFTVVNGIDDTLPYLLLWMVSMILFPIYCCEWYRWYSSLFTVVKWYRWYSSLFTLVNGIDDTLPYILLWMVSMILFPIYCCEWYRWYSSLFTFVNGGRWYSSLFTVVNGIDETLPYLLLWMVSMILFPIYCCEWYRWYSSLFTVVNGIDDTLPYLLLWMVSMILFPYLLLWMVSMILFPIYCCEWYRWYSSLFTVVNGVDDTLPYFTVVNGIDDTLPHLLLWMV